MRDNPGGIVDTTSHLVCRRIARTLIEKYDWALLNEDDLVASVLGSIESSALPAQVKKLTKHHYIVALYQACRQAEDLDRRERAYAELFRFLYRAAYNRWPELAEDAAQAAIVLVYEQIDRCRNPGTFLAFALGKLRHAFQKEQRARGKEESLEDVGRSSVEKEPTAFPMHLDQQEHLQVLRDAITQLPDERQQQTILLKFFVGLSDEAIGVRLGISAGHVRVLRHRGLVRLRKDERLKNYYEA